MMVDGAAVKGPTTDLLSPYAMYRAGHNVMDEDGCMSLFDNQLRLESKGVLYQHFAYR